MPARYAPIPHAVIDHDAELEMNAAFADSGDDDSDSDDDLETKPLHPLARGRSRSHSPSPVRGGPYAPSSSSAAAAGTSALPGAYDFEAVDYDLPPPGSPPPATQAFANNWGNSNGVVPDGVDTYRVPRRGWLGRTAAAILPAHYVSRMPGIGSSRPSGPVGGGNQNDGVFANVTAKPVRGVQVRDGDETYVVPEETQREQPPTYREAQTDAVPTYWDATAVHVAGGSNIPGEVLVDGVPTGTMFSFLWNLLISISFQFVGFLLTYLLHTTHAARLGSRAGLGITLIQYGFSLRKGDLTDSSGGTGESAPAIPTFDNAKDQEDYMTANNISYPTLGSLETSSTPTRVSIIGTETTAEWLAFLLMTVGWFILLTSMLGFIRVKRWERSMLASPPDASAPAAQAPRSGRFDRMFEVPGLSALRSRSLFAPNLAGGVPSSVPPTAGPSVGPSTRSWVPRGLELAALDVALERLADDDANRGVRPGATQFVIDDADPERAQSQTRALVAEQRLNMDLRAAGLL